MEQAREILEKLKNGEISVEEAEQYFRSEPFHEMGFAKLDTHRELRSGFPEVIYCAGKPDDYLVSIYKKMVEADGRAFGTRATKEQFELVRAEISDITYDPVSRILKVERVQSEGIESGAFAVGKLRDSNRRHGGSTCKRNRRSCQESRNCGSDIRGVRCKF